MRNTIKIAPRYLHPCAAVRTECSGPDVFMYVEKRVHNRRNGHIFHAYRRISSTCPLRSRSPDSFFRRGSDCSVQIVGPSQISTRLSRCLSRHLGLCWGPLSFSLISQRGFVRFGFRMRTGKSFLWVFGMFSMWNADGVKTKGWTKGAHSVEFQKVFRKYTSNLDFHNFVLYVYVRKIWLIINLVLIN